MGDLLGKDFGRAGHYTSTWKVHTTRGNSLG